MGTSVEKGVGASRGSAAPGAAAGSLSQASSPRVAIRLLGTLRVLRDGREVPLPTSRKARSLLAYLVMARRPVHRSRLCEMFWDVPNDPRGELRWCLSKLRGVLDEAGHKRVRADKDFVAIETASIEVDVLAVGQAIEGVLADGDVPALDRLAAALDDEFLQGLAADRIPLFEAWLLAQREQCRAWHLRALNRLGTLLEDGDDRRLAVLRKRIEVQPDDLACHRDFLMALVAAGLASEGEAHLGLASRLLKSHGVNPAPLQREWPALRQASPTSRMLLGPTPPPMPETTGPRDGAAAMAGLARLQPPARPAHNLPPRLTSYVGRSEEERDVRARLVSHRVVTLVGAGGVGKTRLALELGRKLIPDMPGGIWLVELAALSDPQLIGETLCSSMGVVPSEGRSAFDTAVAYLRHRRTLVILDNCEHLIDVAAELATMLVKACPDLGVLATSRERLDVPGEGIHLVSGLGLPPDGPMPAVGARKHDACRLFEERARALVGDFSLSDANAGAVCDICRQLDGLPLAIELVVPQLRMVPPQHLAERLHDRMLMAMGGGRGAPPRHRTLLALFDWSYNLLDVAEQRLLRCLAVFNGGWSLDSAAAVADWGADEVFDVLSRLHDKSLVVADLRGTAPRYGMLQTTYQYALLKCDEAGEMPPRDRLAATMLALVRAADEAWPTTPTEAWLERYQPDLDNLRASLDWAFSPAGDSELGAELCAYSLRIWDDLALLSERERWFGVAFENAGPSTPAPVMARLCLGQLSNSAHGDRTNFAAARRAADEFQRCGDGLGLGEALAKAGAALQTPATTGEALPLLQEALSILAPFGSSKPLARCLRSLAVARYFEHDFERARPLLAESKSVARLVGDQRGIAAVQIDAAELSFAASDPDRAVLEIGEMLSGRHASRRQVVLGLTNLAAYLLALDRFAEAHHAGLRALEEALALNWRAAVIRAVEHLALVAAVAGEHEAAAGLLGHCVAFYATGTASREHTEMASYERLRDLVTAALGWARLEASSAEGALWTLDRAVQQARMALKPP